MNKHAILIGVNEIPNLDYLSTPSRYAIEMEDWAISQGYKTSLFVDESNGRPTAGNCCRTDILKTITEIFDVNDQLLIYFAGHAIETNAGNDVWLFPGYENDVNDCVSIYLNRALAYTLGIPHVIFISDACRTPSNSENLRAVTGGGILPKKNRSNPKTEIDILYSTWPGQMSTDIRDEQGIFRSTYSDCLLNCLKGQIPEVIQKVNKDKKIFPAVITDLLNKYLKEAVPVQMEKKGKNPQYPTGEVTSRYPSFVARFDENTIITLPDPGSLKNSIEELSISNLKNMEDKINLFTKNDGGELINKSRYVTDKSLDAAHNSLGVIDYFQHFSTIYRADCMLSISGMENPLIMSNKNVKRFPLDFANFLVPQKIKFEGNKQKSPSVFMIGSEKKLYAVSIIEGYHTQVVFDNDKLLTVNYFPLFENYSDYIRLSTIKDFEEISERKSLIITAAKKGIFLGTEEIAGYLRKYKELDPILGVFAAYAYFQKGNYQGVRSIHEHIMKQKHIIGDIELLNFLSQSDLGFVRDQTEVDIPILREGWSYLKILDNNLYDDLAVLLEPGLWTSFSQKGIDWLCKNYDFKQI